MFRKPIRAGTLKVRYSVSAFIISGLPRLKKTRAGMSAIRHRRHLTVGISLREMSFRPAERDVYDPSSGQLAGIVSQPKSSVASPGRLGAGKFTGQCPAGAARFAGIGFP